MMTILHVSIHTDYAERFLPVFFFRLGLRIRSRVFWFFLCKVRIRIRLKLTVIRNPFLQYEKVRKTTYLSMNMSLVVVDSVLGPPGVVFL